MPNTTIGSANGPAAKKETVYSGPAPQTNQGTVYNGPSPASAGTVYGGPAMKPAGSGTVYRTPQPVANASSTRPAPAKGAGIFFAIAIVTALNTVLIAAGSSFVLGRGLSTSKIAAPGQMTGIVVLNVLVVGIFVLIGIFARQGSKAAFVIGMLLYGGDTALLVLSGDPAMHVGGIVVHVILLIYLFKGFSQLES